MRENYLLFFHQTPAKPAPFFKAMAPNKSAEEESKDNGHPHQVKAGLCHLNLMGPTTGLLPSLIEEENDNRNQPDSRHTPEKPSDLSHLVVLSLRLPVVHDNSKDDEENQCKNESTQGIGQNKWFLGKNPHDQNRKGDLSTIEEEFRYVFPSAFIHSTNRVSKSPNVVNKNMQENYYEKSIAAIRASSLLIVVLCAFGFLTMSASFAGAEVAAVDSTTKAPAASDQKQVSPAASSVLISKEIVSESTKKKAGGGNENLEGSPNAALSVTPVKMVTKTLTGEVSAKGPTGIAIVYEKNVEERWSKEYWFPFEEDIKLLGYRSLKDIEERDKVTIGYEEAEDGSKRILRRIALTRKAPREIPTVEEEESVDTGEELRSEATS